MSEVPTDSVTLSTAHVLSEPTGAATEAVHPPDEPREPDVRGRRAITPPQHWHEQHPLRTGPAHIPDRHHQGRCALHAVHNKFQAVPRHGVPVPGHEEPGSAVRGRCLQQHGAASRGGPGRRPSEGPGEEINPE